MSEVVDLLVKLINEQSAKIDDLKKSQEKLEEKVDELIALKNKVIAVGVFCSVIFAYIWDWCKNFFGRN